MKTILYATLILLISLVFLCCKTTLPQDQGIYNINPNEGKPDDEKIQRIGFYNVENLFDTQDDEGKDDKEFLPTGKNEWTTERYQEKLNHLAEVIHYMGQPGIMGLAEIENETTLKDLINEASLKGAKYKIVHQESPDFRGIDVALLYSEDEYTLVSKNFITINFPKNIVENYTTRDILYAILQNKKQEQIHVFVCHWPSRRGGEEASEPKRIYVAQQVRNEVDRIFKESANSNIVIIGDLNDEPTNKSVNQTLGAKAEIQQLQPTELYNLMYGLKNKGYGTYSYQNNWNMLDHIIVSGTLLDGKKIDVKNAKIFNRKFMMYYNEKSKEYRPNRTFSSGKYYGGYSDHLPVSVEIK